MSPFFHARLPGFSRIHQEDQFEICLASKNPKLNNIQLGIKDLPGLKYFRKILQKIW